MSLLNKAALAIALICVAAGTGISVLAIWGFIGDTGIVWRSLATLGVIFLGTILTVTVNNMLGTKRTKNGP